MAPLSELLIRESDVLCVTSVLVFVLKPVLTAVLREVVEDMAPLSELLIREREVLWLLSTVLTAALRLDVEEIAPLRELLICERDVETLRSGVPLPPDAGWNGSPT